MVVASSEEMFMQVLVNVKESENVCLTSLGLDVDGVFEGFFKLMSTSAELF